MKSQGTSGSSLEGLGTRGGGLECCHPVMAVTVEVDDSGNF